MSIVYGHDEDPMVIENCQPDQAPSHLLQSLEDRVLNSM